MTRINEIYKPWFTGEIRIETIDVDKYRLMVLRAGTIARKVVREFEEHIFPWGLANLGTCLQHNLPMNYKVEVWPNSKKIDVSCDGEVLVRLVMKEYVTKRAYNKKTTK